MTSTRLPRATWLAAAFVVVALAGCRVAGPEPRTFVGPVTVASRHSVCVGGPDASGACFVKDRMTKGLRVSDCLRVTYTPEESVGYETPTEIEHLDAASHSDDCPRQ